MRYSFTYILSTESDSYLRSPFTFNQRTFILFTKIDIIISLTASCYYYAYVLFPLYIIIVNITIFVLSASVLESEIDNLLCFFPTVTIMYVFNIENLLLIFCFRYNKISRYIENFPSDHIHTQMKELVVNSYMLSYRYIYKK